MFIIHQLRKNLMNTSNATNSVEHSDVTVFSKGGKICPSLTWNVQSLCELRLWLDKDQSRCCCIQQWCNGNFLVPLCSFNYWVFCYCRIPFLETNLHTNALRLKQHFFACVLLNHMITDIHVFITLLVQYIQKHSHLHTLSRY